MKRLLFVVVVALSLSACDDVNDLAIKTRDCERHGLIVKSAQWGAWGWEVTCVRPEAK